MENCIPWRTDVPHPEEGVLVAADEAQSWLLPWWWEHYSRYNHYPVTFVDLGLSEKSQEWCKERGQRIPLPSYPLVVKDKSQIDPTLAADWELFYGGGFWPKRPLFFLKPFICLQTPYRKTLWLDLDCEVRSCIQDIFLYLADAPGFCISHDLILESTQKKVLYNGGVFGFSHGHPLISEWAVRTLDLNSLFYSDQELLSHLIAARNEPIAILPQIYQWSHFLEDNALARIVHRHGDSGKKAIYESLKATHL